MGKKALQLLKGLAHSLFTFKKLVSQHHRKLFFCSMAAHVSIQCTEKFLHSWSFKTQLFFYFLEEGQQFSLIFDKFCNSRNWSLNIIVNLFFARWPLTYQYNVQKGFCTYGILRPNIDKCFLFFYFWEEGGHFLLIFDKICNFRYCSHSRNWSRNIFLLDGRSRINTMYKKVSALMEF